MRIQFLSKRVHHIVFDVIRNTHEVIIVDIDDDSGPASYKQQVSIYVDKLGFESDLIDKEDDNISFREFCFPDEASHGANNIQQVIGRVETTAKDINVQLNHLKWMVLVSIFFIGFVIGKLSTA